MLSSEMDIEFMGPQTFQSIVLILKIPVCLFPPPFCLSDACVPLRALILTKVCTARYTGIFEESSEDLLRMTSHTSLILQPGVILCVSQYKLSLDSVLCTSSQLECCSTITEFNSLMICHK